MNPTRKISSETEQRHARIRAALRSVTRGAREDMHEPDEQGIKARVIGDHLDNAMGAAVMPDLLIRGAHEFVVVIEQLDDSGMRVEQFNLADLIAMALTTGDPT